MVRRTLFFLLACLSSWAQAGVTMKPMDGVAPALVVELRRTIEAFGGILKQEFGFTEDIDARVVVCPTEACYYEVLRKDGGYSHERAELTARATGGVTGVARNTIYIKLLSPTGLSRARFVMAHELTHIVQGKLIGSAAGMERANRWIKEGMADWVGALVANRLGDQSFAKWQLDRINSVRMASNPVAPQDLGEVSFMQWTTWTDQRRQPYEMADLMFMALAEKKEAEFPAAMMGYMRCMGTFSRESTCFRDSFGVTQRDFHREFPEWLQRAYAGGKAVEVVAGRVAADKAAVIEAAHAQTQRLLSEHLGEGLTISMRIFLAEDSEEMAQLLVRELGYTVADAERSVRGSTSIWQGSVAILDAGRLSTDERLAASTASLLVGRHLQLAGNSRGQFAWMAFGLREYMASLCLETMGLRSSAASQQLRQEQLRAAKRALPALVTLATTDAYRQAQREHGAAVVLGQVVSAAELLVQKSGWARIAEWVRATKTAADPGEVFASSFGLSAERFSEQLAERLRVADSWHYRAPVLSHFNAFTPGIP
ncbi:hypothetical protein [Viridibacterium curvum]|uniref:Peptidase MA-like domain-containing protein n=1 Tax=Viridibacterium curvum TaxID=1101404 RepID=A0ABP9QNF2_9RHOO